MSGDNVAQTSADFKAADRELAQEKLYEAILALEGLGEVLTWRPATDDIGEDDEIDERERIMNGVGYALNFIAGGISYASRLLREGNDSAAAAA